MKKLTILTTLLTILALGCNAQEPQTILNHLDSLSARSVVIMDSTYSVGTLNIRQ